MQQRFFPSYHGGTTVESNDLKTFEDAINQTYKLLGICLHLPGLFVLLLCSRTRYAGTLLALPMNFAIFLFLFFGYYDSFLLTNARPELSLLA